MAFRFNRYALLLNGDTAHFSQRKKNSKDEKGRDMVIVSEK